MLSILLQAAGGQSSMMSLAMLALMGLVFYFFIIRPQSQKQKKEKEFQAELKKGDKVVTTSGIHGKISHIGEHTVSLETGAGKITFEKSAVSAELTSEVNKEETSS